MQSRRFVAVWLGVGVLAACGVPSDDFEQAADVSAIHAAVADEPLASPGAVLGQLAQRAYVKASNTGARDNFGFSVALSADGSTLAVGSVGDDSAATGVGGDQADGSAPGAGAVYVFRRRGTTWLQQAYLKASNTGAGDNFGYSVALSADGSTLAVGAPGEDSAATGTGGDQANDSAPDSGAVYVFTRRGMKWRQTAYVKASNTGGSDSPGFGDSFGASVALSADGSTLAVGAPHEDSAATGVGGDQADDSALEAGAVYVLAQSGTGWSQEAYVKASNTEASDAFGYSVALSADGSTLAVSGELESSAATGVGGDQADNSAPYSGAVYVFARSGTAWCQEAYVKASNTDSADAFGYRLALSGDGATLAVGAINENSGATGIDGDQGNTLDRPGAVYVFARGSAMWSQQAYVKASNSGESDVFGASVALSGDGSRLAVGAPNEHSAATGIGGDQADNSAYGAGAVYVFARSGTTWSQELYVKASNTGEIDYFGASVALSADGSTLAVGAPEEDSPAIEIDGDQADDSAPGAGAVYVFDRRHQP
jgi:FG-GAP repeat